MDECGSEVQRVRDPSVPWMLFLLDTNPLDGIYDQLFKLAIAPINIEYQAIAINNAIDVFKPPESVCLNQLTALAMSRYEEVKAHSVTGLAHAVEHRSRLVLDVQIQPARIYISEGGAYYPKKPCSPISEKANGKYIGSQFQAVMVIEYGYRICG